MGELPFYPEINTCTLMWEYERREQAAYTLNGRATIIDVSYRLLTWESYHAWYLVQEFAAYILHGRATMKPSTSVPDCPIY